MYSMVIIVGRLGADAELRKAADAPVANFRVAVSDRKDAATTWYRVALWGQRANALHQHLTKGRLVMVSGRLAMREWTDSAGARRVTPEVTASDIVLLGPRSGEQQAATADVTDVTDVTDGADIPF